MDCYPKIAEDIGEVSNKILKNKIFILFLLFSPGFWWIIGRFPSIFNGFLKNPQPFRLMDILFSEERLVAVGLTRWPSIETFWLMRFMSKMFYNRINLIVDDFFNFLTFLSPRIYFQAGDGSKFTPSNMEPIPLILFPLAVWGFLREIKSGKFGGLVIGFVAAFLSFSFMNKSMQFLWPVLIIYIWYSAIGFLSLKGIFKSTYTILLVVYFLFLSGRVLWTVLPK